MIHCCWPVPIWVQQSRLPVDSGACAEVSYRTLTRLRRVSQVSFFALFLFLLVETEFRGSFEATSSPVELAWPVSWFLQIDPLVAVTHALANGALYKGLLWSLVILIPTLFLGRFFCGWVCPLGTLNHFVGSWKSERKRGARRIQANRYQRWQTLKYYILIVVLAAAVVGYQLAGILDPISLTVRSLGLSILPGLRVAFYGFLDGLYASGVGALQFAADALDFVVGGPLFTARPLYFAQGFFLGLLFLFILALNLRITRFWCRALCPLGALLGLLSRWSILGLEKDKSRCEDCNLCLLDCQGGDDPIPGVPWRKAECHLCLNCVSDCPETGIRFRFFPVSKAVEGPNLLRRRVVGSVAGGAALVPLLTATAGRSVARNSRLIRPPGSVDEEHFVQRCIRCGECMKVCPNNALHPTLFEAGIEGIWSPVLVPRIGYCEPSCTLCGQVCPTGAIWEFSAEEKGWIGESNPNPISIGTAFYDRGRCLPWAMAIECIVCEEWCPTSPKAVFLREETVYDAEGREKRLRRPYIDPKRCIGCGACEYACPVEDRPAVYVTSIGESRSRANQILLERRRKKGGAS